jgi:hypothetical protein
MALAFPSVEWIEEYKKQINTSEGYKKAGATWTAGPVALVISAKPEIGLNEDVVAPIRTCYFPGFSLSEKEIKRIW